MLVPIILGSDKTTVSVATGHNKYYPVYMSIGNVWNNFRKFRRQLFHSSLAQMLSSVRPAMSTPEVTRTPDGHFRRVIYSIGPYIVDSPEQSLLACTVGGWCPRCTARLRAGDPSISGERRSQELTIALINALDERSLWYQYGIVGYVMPFTSEFPRADIYELVAPDILHQVVKGTFKDHLVTWVGEYLDLTSAIALAPPFPGLRRFPQGRGFKQWTGDDSKALMKVYLPALEGHLPADVIRAFRAFLDFCYLVQQDMFNEDIAPNGLCSSITESKHIKAVKEPWRCSNCCNALGQMLVINQRLDKLTASRSYFESKGMIKSVVLADACKRAGLFGNDKGIRRPSQSWQASFTNPIFKLLSCRFLFDQLHLDNPNAPAGSDVPLSRKVSVYHTATAIFYSPSNLSGIQGMRSECIRCNPRWRKRTPRFDTAFDKYYPCALIRWFVHVGDVPDEVMGLWVRQPDTNADGTPAVEVIYLDLVLCGAHLLPIFGDSFMPIDLSPHNSLDAFETYYINKYIDYHAFEFAS
ncbi:hypothetical protein EDB84DRAFT_1586692 [Lactarius hengduanensis]|nr:hypothetical protein EDB84DRAFT_1586692 [Lactarius hengduanensis]